MSTRRTPMAAPSLLRPLRRSTSDVSTVYKTPKISGMIDTFFVLYRDSHLKTKWGSIAALARHGTYYALR